MRMVRRKYQPSARTRAMRESLFGPTMLPSIEELECRPEPSHEQVEASLQRAPILRRFRRLVEFLGDGRAVTTAGTVVLDDARALVPLLGTTDVIDPRLGDEVLPTRSAESLPDLHATISLAKRTGVVRIHRGRLVSTKKGRAVDRHADDPVFAAAHAVVGIGPLQLCLGRRFGSPVQHWIDERSIHLLCDLHFAGGSVAFDDLVADWRERYDEVVDDLFISVRDELPEKRLDELRDCWSAAFFEHELEQALDVFELCGLLRRSGHATRMLLPDLAMREGGELSVTPFGEWFLWGVVLHAEAMAVVRADAARDPWASVSIGEEGDVERVLDVLLGVLRSTGPETMVETFTTIGPLRHQAEWCDLVWRSPRDGTLDVLEAIGRTHPDTVVAKAARKAAFKRRSAAGPARAS